MNATDSPHGFIVLQSNRLEALRDVTLAWMRQHPLHPLESTTFLVQSNGIAQWLKGAVAQQEDASSRGVCMGVEVMLPARFQWLAYRSVIAAAGDRTNVPRVSPYDKTRLRWRLMALLPKVLDTSCFAPLAQYLRDDHDQRRCFQLAERLADLFDQYQVYRADWLDAWEAGRDTVTLSSGIQTEIPASQRWQPALWRLIGDTLSPEARHSHRGAVHQRFLHAAATLKSPPVSIPPRIVVFGISALPRQTLQVLAELARFSEVILCLLNPCEYFWGEIIDHQEALRRTYRQRRKQGMPVLPDPESLHLHAHPLLAAWGKQGRDYLQMLAQYDATERHEQAFAAIEQPVDCFQRPETTKLLGQLQDDILNLRSVQETRQQWPALDPDRDQSLVFHVCHSPQRELEVLHDQLLAAFAKDPTLQPRDIMVMVPDIDDYTPFVHAVFGQFSAREKRHIPYRVADQPRRDREPLVRAFETLLNLPQLRFRASEMLDLLDVPAIRRRFEVDEGDLPLLQRWIEGANIRWGLDAAQRGELDLPAHTDLHTWRFGLSRMLMGYAVGRPEDNADDWAQIVPYDEVGGLDAARVGPLFRLIETLDWYRTRLRHSRPAHAWAALLGELLDATLAPASPRDETLLGGIRDTLEIWAEEVDEAALHGPLTLAIVRESLLADIDAPRLSRSFLGGAVTFATLMPMRAIPFRHICLLGMKDGRYPRRDDAPDFDLMARHEHYRPGDRSRRDDDRYLFLEALLSARERLYISWDGYSPKDNGEQPPSVLVNQLREHLSAGWQAQADAADADAENRSLLTALTTEHPLQAFGSAYFSAASPLFTYAREWQALHEPDGRPTPAPHTPRPWWPETPVHLEQLAALLRNPVEAFYRQRFDTRLQHEHTHIEDDEPFAFDALQAWQQREALLRPIAQQLATNPDLAPQQALSRRIERFQRAGAFAPEPVGPVLSRKLTENLAQALCDYRSQIALYDGPITWTAQIQHVFGVQLSDSTDAPARNGAITLADTLDHLFYRGRSEAPEALARIVLLTSRAHSGKDRNWRALLPHWPAHLALQCLKADAPSYLVTPSGTVQLPGMSSERACTLLHALCQQWIEAMQHPLPTCPELAFSALQYQAREGEHARPLGAARPSEWPAELEKLHDRSPLFKRDYPDLQSIVGAAEFAAASDTLYGPIFRLLHSCPEAFS